jgi:tetratricopeptide (TPR) repeat protein
MPAQMELIGQAKALANDLKWSEAADVLASALADDPENIVLLDKRGWYLSRAKRYAEAIAVYEFLASRRPGQAKWPYMVGYQYYDQQRWKQAIAWFDRALALRDQYIVVLYRRYVTCGKHSATVADRLKQSTTVMRVSSSVRS